MSNHMQILCLLIRRVNAQRYMPLVQTNSTQNFNSSTKFGKTTTSLTCTYFNQVPCVQKKSHETRGVYTNTFVPHGLHQ